MTVADGKCKEQATYLDFVLNKGHKLAKPNIP